MGIEKVDGGYKNVQPGTGRTFSKKPMSKEKVLAQLRAMKSNQHGSGGDKGGKK